MTELDNLEQELSAGLAALEKPCNCHETQNANENPFAEFSVSDDLTSELELALSSLEGTTLSPEESLEFASISSSNNIGLNELISVLEQHPGLKITFSF
jgi:hypothetical protein